MADPRTRQKAARKRVQRLARQFRPQQVATPELLAKLLDLGETYAQACMLDTVEGMRMTFFLVGQRLETVAVSWADDQQKAVGLARLRHHIHTSDVVAYAFAGEIWTSAAADRAIDPAAGGWRPDDRPSKQPDRQEMVQVFATDGVTVRSSWWEMRRDPGGVIQALERDPDPPEFISGIFADLLPVARTRH